MKILILGGAGFIGSHLADYHLSLNDTVLAVDNLSTGKLDNINQHNNNVNFSFYKEDILNWPDLESILPECDVVYDLAAVVGMFNVLEHPISTLHVNINITEKILSIITKLERKPLVVIASSSEVYGSRHAAMKESDSLITAATDKGHASYPISKLCNEITGMAYYKEKKLPLIIVRIFNTVGPKQSSRYGMVLPRFVRQACNNEVLTIFSDGMQTRSFCDVRDLCQILQRLTQNEKSLGQIVNIGNDASISILDLANLVIDLCHSKSELKFKSYEEAYGTEYIEIEHRKPDLGKLRTLIDYQHQWTLEETIRDIINTILIGKKMR